jgi:hypothetical protein
MATAKVKNIKKVDWQKIAKSHKVKFDDSNTVRYLVEKVAENIGVDDKIVKLDDLKQAVHDALEGANYDFAKFKYPAKKKTTKKSTTKKTTAKKSTAKSKPKKETKTDSGLSPDALEIKRKTHYIREAHRLGVNFGMEQTSSDILQLIQLFCKQQGSTYEVFHLDVPAPNISENDNPAPEAKVEEAKDEQEDIPQVDRLTQLRKECEALGLAYGEAHTAQDLEQLINAIKGSAPVNPQANPSTNPPPPPVAEEQPPMLGANQVAEVPAFLAEQQQVHKEVTVAPTFQEDIKEVDDKQLRVYGNSILQTVNAHFRPMMVSEIQELLSRANYPFSYEFERHPSDGSKLAIILTSKNKSVRVPNENKDDWMTISG